MLCAEFHWYSHGGKRNKKTEPKPIQRIGKRVSKGMCGNVRPSIILGGPPTFHAPPLRTILSASVVFVYISTRKNKNHSQTTLLTQHTPDSWKQQRRTNLQCTLDYLKTAGSSQQRKQVCAVLKRDATKFESGRIKRDIRKSEPEIVWDRRP